MQVTISEMQMYYSNDMQKIQESKNNNSKHVYQYILCGYVEKAQKIKLKAKQQMQQNVSCCTDIDTLSYLPDVNAVPLAAPNVERVTAKGMRKAAQPNTRFPKV